MEKNAPKRYAKITDQKSSYFGEIGEVTLFRDGYWTVTMRIADSLGRMGLTAWSFTPDQLEFLD